MALPLGQLHVLFRLFDLDVNNLYHWTPSCTPWQVLLLLFESQMCINVCLANGSVEVTARVVFEPCLFRHH